MFGKKKKQKKMEEAKGKVATILRNGTIIGDLFTKGSLRIEGKIKGVIKAEGDLFVGVEGVLNTQIEARNVIIAGTVNGDIIANGKIELLKSGKLKGNIRAKSIKIEEGAYFAGESKPMDNQKNIDVSEKDDVSKKAKKEVAVGKEKA